MLRRAAKMPAAARGPARKFVVMKSAVFALVCCLPLLGCGSSHNLVNARAFEWKAKADLELPTGTSMEAATTWAARNKVTFSHPPKQGQLTAVVERLPETGLNRFVCSEWLIILKVNLSESGATTGNEVSTVGRCL
jgi:hypothetical protein